METRAEETGRDRDPMEAVAAVEEGEADIAGAEVVEAAEDTAEVEVTEGEGEEEGSGEGEEVSASWELYNSRKRDKIWYSRRSWQLPWRSRR